MLSSGLKNYFSRFSFVEGTRIVNVDRISDGTAELTVEKNSKKTRIVFDVPNKKCVVQAKNADGTLQSQFTIQGN